MENSSPQELKILYAIQGTGNGHVARAREIVPILQKFGQVDIVLSGDQSNIDIGASIKYRSKGFTFVYNKRGGVSLWRSFFKNNIFELYKEIKDFPVAKYDVVVNDFEFISAWAAKLRKVKCFGLGHQASFLSAKTPRPSKTDLIGEWILKYYAPCSDPIGFHFHSFDSFIHTPVIRKGIRDLKPIDNGHYVVYLPAYGDEQIFEVLSKIQGVEWKVFSKRTQRKYQKDNLTFIPVNNDDFIQNLTTCKGVLTSAGFETPAESLFLGKKLLVIPIKNQYEQYCNAEALRDIGIPVINELHRKHIPTLQHWTENMKPIQVDYPDITEQIIEKDIFRKMVINELKDAEAEVSVIY